MKLPNNYFPHDFNARSDRKILRMRKALGIEGYGIYWMLIETLATEENFSYPIADIDLLADRFGTSTEKVEAVVKQFQLFEIDQEAKFFSTSLINRMQKFVEASEKGRMAANVRWTKFKKLKAAKEKEEVELEDKIRNLWVRTFSKSPNILEAEETQKLIDRFGEKKTYEIMKEGVKKNFRSIFTLTKSLSTNGVIRPKDSDNPGQKKHVYK